VSSPKSVIQVASRRRCLPCSDQLDGKVAWVVVAVVDGELRNLLPDMARRGGDQLGPRGGDVQLGLQKRRSHVVSRVAEGWVGWAILPSTPRSDKSYGVYAPADPLWVWGEEGVPARKRRPTGRLLR
jgi:hypothetical protein